jgi:hypothetical protein
MLAIVPPANDGATGYYVRVIEGTGPVNSARAVPDLTDPATLGCLLALVRESWGVCVHVAPDTGWHVRRAVLPNGSTINLGIVEATEAAALVAALEAASCD